MLRSVTRLAGALFVIALVNACATQGSDVRKSAEVGTVSDVVPDYNEAVTAAKEGDTDKAIELFENVTQAKPDFAIAYTDLGLQYLKNNEMDKADKAFEKSISLDQGNYVAYNHRGVILRNKGDFSGAKEMYMKALEYNPDYANANLNIAILLDIYLYDLKQALYHYKKYQSLTGDSDKLVGKWIVDLERRIANEEGISK